MMMIRKGRHFIGATGLLLWAVDHTIGADLMSESVADKCEDPVGDGSPKKCFKEVIIELKVMPEEQGSTEIYLLHDAGSPDPAPIRLTIRSDAWSLNYPLTYERTLYDSMWETTILKTNDFFGGGSCEVPATCGVAFEAGKAIPNSGGFCCDCNNILTTQPEAMYRPFADSEYNHIHGYDNHLMDSSSKNIVLDGLGKPMDCGVFSHSWGGSGQCLRFPSSVKDAAGHPPYWTPFTPHQCDIDPTICFPNEGRQSVIPPVAGVHYVAHKYHAAVAGGYTLNFRTHIDVEKWSVDSEEYQHSDTVTLDQNGMKVSYENITAQFSMRGGEMTQFPDLTDDYIFLPAYEGPRSDILVIPNSECDPTGLSPGKIFFEYSGHAQTANCGMTSESILKDASLRHKWNTDADNAREKRPLKYLVSKFNMFLPKEGREVCRDYGTEEVVLNRRYHKEGKKDKFCDTWGLKFKVSNQVIPGVIRLELDNVKPRYVEQVQPGFLNINTLRDFTSGETNGAVSFTVTNSGKKPSQYFVKLDKCDSNDARVTPSTFTVSSKPRHPSSVYMFSVIMTRLSRENRTLCCDMTLVSSLGIQLADIHNTAVLDEKKVCLEVAGFVEDTPDAIQQGVGGEDGFEVEPPSTGLSDVVNGAVGGMVDVVAGGGDAIADTVNNAVNGVVEGVADGVQQGLEATTNPLAEVVSSASEVPVGLIPAVSVLAPLGLFLVVAICLCKRYRKKQKEKKRANKAARKAVDKMREHEHHPAAPTDDYQPDTSDYDEWARATTHCGA